jgi:hypothetical protein
VSEILIFKLISPAIVSPEAFHLLPADLLPSRKARRNLVLITKLLRNCTSGHLTGREENYMKAMNSFTTEMQPILSEHIAQVCRTPPQANTRLSGSSATSGEGVHAFELPHLLDMHLCLLYCKSRLTEVLQKESSSILPGLRQSAVEFLSSLGPAPCILGVKGVKSIPWRAANRGRSASFDYESVGSVTGEVIRKDSESDASESDLISLESSSLDKAGFFFVGPNSREGLPVLYIIANRVRPEIFRNVDVLITYVYQILTYVGTSRYLVVIDMSWTRFSDDLKELLYTQLQNIFSVMEHRIRKNLARIFIVHPSAYTRAVIRFARQFTSSKLKAKIVEIYNWQALESDINLEDIAIPETSKDFITKTYGASKVNAKGKSQKRLIKFTATSILNIDPRTKRIQNEREIKNFGQIDARVDGAEMQIHFANATPSLSRRFSGKKGTSGDLLLRKYVFDTAQERDEVLLEIFRTAFYASACQYPQEYKVTKINKRGRHQERLFKLTCDSLLNLDGTLIKVCRIRSRKGEDFSLSMVLVGDQFRWNRISLER